MDILSIVIIDERGKVKFKGKIFITMLLNKRKEANELKG